MLKLALGAFVAGIAMFVWGFVYWGLGIVDGFSHVSPEGEAAITQALKANLSADGTYMLPDMKNGTMDEFSTRMSAGPFTQIHYHAAGATMGDPMVMLKGFVHMLITAALLAFTLQMLAPATPSYLDRLKVMALIGFTAAFFMHLGNPIWWHHDWLNASVLFLYDFAAYVIAGAVLAYFVAPQRA
jgi:hypothetical protein